MRAALPFVCWLSAVFSTALAADAPPLPAGRTYFVDVDSVGGPSDDANPGTAAAPWRSALKAFSAAGPGDTVVFRRGTYRLPRTVHTSDLRLDPERTGTVTFTAPAGEPAVLTNLRPIPAADWTPVATSRAGQAIFAAPAGREARVTNLTQHGTPMRRAFSGHLTAWYADTTPEAIAAPGEWASDWRTQRVYLCPLDGAAPADGVEVCDAPGKGASGNLLTLERDPADRCRRLHLVFENLTLETGFHGLVVRTGFVELRRCLLRKSSGDLINTVAGRVLVEDCDFQAFGESAIDVTGADGRPLPPGAPPMAIRNSRFHHNVVVRAPGQKGTNGVMLKGGCADVVIEGNRFFDLRAAYGALTLGGATDGGRPGEARRLTARNNIFRAIAGPYVVLFAGSEDCRLVNNLVFECAAPELIAITRANASDPATSNLRPRVQNNIFYRNPGAGATVAADRGAATELIFDHNLISASGNHCRLDGETLLLAALPARGYQQHGVARAPRFRDPARHDYRSAWLSPVVDRGADLGELVPRDASGRSRPHGHAFDLGPFER